MVRAAAVLPPTSVSSKLNASLHSATHGDNTVQARQENTVLIFKAAAYRACMLSPVCLQGAAAPGAPGPPGAAPPGGAIVPQPGFGMVSLTLFYK